MMRSPFIAGRAAFFAYVGRSATFCRFRARSGAFGCWYGGIDQGGGSRAEARGGATIPRAILSAGTRHAAVLCVLLRIRLSSRIQPFVGDRDRESCACQERASGGRFWGGFVFHLERISDYQTSVAGARQERKNPLPVLLRSA